MAIDPYVRNTWRYLLRGSGPPQLCHLQVNSESTIVMMVIEVVPQQREIRKRGDTESLELHTQITILETK